MVRRFRVCGNRCTEVQTLHGFDMRSAAEKQAANNEAPLTRQRVNATGHDQDLDTSGECDFLDSCQRPLKAPKEGECFSLRIADDAGRCGILMHFRIL